MLIELAVGDAYGAGFEYATENIPHNNLARYVQHPRHTRICPGCYTDDTQMSLAIAELMIEGGEWTPLNIANKFVECFKRDERTGYSAQFYEFLKSVQSGADFLEKMNPASDKSGAAMRAVPLGLYPTIAEVLYKTEIQARITHDIPDGIQAAQAVALMSHYFLYNLGAKADVSKFLLKYVDGDWHHDYRGKVKSKGWMSTRAAITALKRNSTMSSLLIDCINFTGDVDTVATIALGCAAHCVEIEQDLPEHLIMSMENKTYGREYIQQLDAQLMMLKQV